MVNVIVEVSVVREVNVGKQASQAPQFGQLHFNDQSFVFVSQLATQMTVVVTAVVVISPQDEQPAQLA